LGLLAHAAATLKRATKEDPDLAEAWAELGYVREQQRMFSKAIQAYSQLHDLQPDNHDLLLRLVKLNLKLNNPDQALRLFLNGPEDEDLRLQVVDILLQNGFYPQAQKALDRLTQKGDPSPKVFLFRAILAYESRQDLGKAIACLRQIPASASFYPQGLFLQGRIFMDSDQPQKALEVAKEGKQKFSDLPGFWVLHSDALRALDQPKQALQTITAALKHWPKDTELLYQQGFLYQALNRTKKAIATMEHIISLDPEHADALNFVGYSLAEQGRQLDRSLVLIKNAVELKPENGYIRDSLAWVYFQRQEYQEAWGAIQKAIDLQARDPIVWEHYGDIAAALNKTDKAKRGYEQALKSGSKDQARLRQKIKALEED
jgi:tetratricopeptide (TPR) repeat protein